ncbi:hypothetical protein [Halorubrum vacuolatum]|uniref:Uncharacterized protein n=1 Tax=Halorubrum vacuolatum TaxID=63740 RepID=A0A238VW05_HALVU|nr:hypothetical protein [Halorubrum vacuolatum]SNR38371.1 hypothetical protein SAMN06264855_104138 [Halorubrum vacuolatum]
MILSAALKLNFVRLFQHRTASGKMRGIIIYLLDKTYRYTKCMIRREPSEVHWDELEIEHVYIDDTEVYGEKRIPRETEHTTFYDEPTNRTYVIKCNSGEIFEFSGGTASENERRADVFMTLWLRTGGFKIGDNQTMVPAQIAALGKPSIAAYLDVTQELDRNRIGELLRISKGTVEQYISKVRRGHR